MKAKLFNVNWMDFGKGLLISVLTSGLMFAYSAIEQALSSGTFDIEWKLVILAGIGGGISYILKNWLTDSDGKLMKKEENIKGTTN